MKRARLAALVIVVAAAIALIPTSCSQKQSSRDGAAAGGKTAPAAHAPLRKILFVGVDGADWEIIGPLIEKGRLPHFAELVRNGATGNLRSLEPMLSPLLWTTMATGKLPEEHGILSFTAYDEATGKKVPVSRSARRVDAFWNMLGDYGRTADVVGWLATYPAEKIAGVMVTDRVGYLAYAGAENANMPGNISPEGRSGEIAAQVVNAASVQYGDFKRFVPVDERAFLAARARAFDPKDPINNMIMLYASTQSYHNISKHLMRVDRPDFFGVYFELVDAACHLFMHYAPPRRPEADAAHYALFKDTVEETYVLQDEILGDLMSQADASTVIMLASDHGFRSGVTRPRGSPEIFAGKAAFWHRLDGVICLHGNGVRKGQHLTQASLLDIAPTILALQGLPKPADMPGKILAEAFDDSLAARFDRTPVATLQKPREQVTASADDPAAREAMKKLEALGYITRESPDQHNNLGQRYQKQGQHEKAIGEFKKALALKPNFPGALNNLGVSYMELGALDQADAALQKALSLKADDVYAMNNLAVIEVKRGNLNKARTWAEKAVTTEPNYANGHLTLGSIYGTMKQMQKAEREFRKVLEIDPSNRHAQEYLEKMGAAPNSKP